MRHPSASRRSFDGANIVRRRTVDALRLEIDIELAGDVLTISGKEAKEEKVERKDYYRYERPWVRSAAR